MLTCYIQGSSLCPRVTISPKRSLIQFNGEVKKWLDWECMCCGLCAKLLQSCPTLCSPMDCSPPGSSVHAILQASILEWVVMPFSRGSSQPRDWTRVPWSRVSPALVGGFFTTVAAWIGRVLPKAPSICLMSRLVGETHLSGSSWFLSSGCSHSSYRNS